MKTLLVCHLQRPGSSNTGNKPNEGSTGPQWWKLQSTKEKMKQWNNWLVNLTLLSHWVAWTKPTQSPQSNSKELICWLQVLCGCLKDLWDTRWFQKKTKPTGLRLPNVRSFYKSTVITAQAESNGPADQDPRNNPYIVSPLVYSEGKRDALCNGINWSG